MHSDLSLLRQLQSLDVRIGELEHELSALPRHVAEIEKKLESHRKGLADLKTALEENEKERRQLEGSVQLTQEKIERLQIQLNEAKTNEQYRAFRNEIAFAQKEVRKAEDRILEMLETAEDLTARIADAEQALEKEEAVVAEEVEETKGRFKGDQDELARVQKQRAEVAEGADRKLLSLYELARHRLKGAAVSPIVDNRCTACNMFQRPQVLQRLHQANRVVTCEFCDAILYDPAQEDPKVEDPAGDSGIV